jgi:hypothetical protein
MQMIKAPLAAAIAVALLAAPSATIAKPEHSAKATEALAKALAGRTAGPAVRCVPNFRSSDMKIVDDGTILFGEGRTVYLQRPAGGCPGLGIGGNSLVARQFATNRMCQGDINEVVDVRNGITIGSCVFEDFIPYTKGAVSK